MTRILEALANVHGIAGGAQGIDSALSKDPDIGVISPCCKVRHPDKARTCPGCSTHHCVCSNKSPPSSGTA